MTLNKINVIVGRNGAGKTEYLYSHGEDIFKIDNFDCGLDIFELEKKWIRAIKNVPIFWKLAVVVYTNDAILALGRVVQNKDEVSVFRLTKEFPVRKMELSNVLGAIENGVEIRYGEI